MFDQQSHENEGSDVDDDDVNETKSLNTCTSSADVRLRRFIASSFRIETNHRKVREQRKNEETRDSRREGEDTMSSRRPRRHRRRVLDMPRREFRSHREMRTRFCHECYTRWLRRAGTCAYVENDYRPPTTAARSV